MQSARLHMMTNTQHSQLIVQLRKWGQCQLTSSFKNPVWRPTSEKLRGGTCRPDLSPAQRPTCHPKCVALWWICLKGVWFLKIPHHRSPPDAWSPSPWGHDSPRCHSSTGCCAGVETTRLSCEGAAGPGSKVGTQCENWWTAAKGAELFNSCMQKSVA